jgi:hypothetical protein
LSKSVEVLFLVLAALGWITAPVTLIWGWTLWTKRPKLRSVTSVFSLLGFILATCSAVLAVSSVAFAHVHLFPFYDPLLMRIFRWGTVLSALGFFMSLEGVWRKNSLRWHSPICALGMLAFWLLAAEGE